MSLPPLLADKNAFLKTFLGDAAPPRDAYWARLLDTPWPELTLDASGSVVLKKSQARWLQDLCEAFGLELDVAHADVWELGHVYDVCVLALGPFINKKLTFPELNLAAYLDDWPTDWVQYVQAVATRDTSRARKLAQALKPLAPEQGWPCGVHVLKKDAQGLPLSTPIPARLATRLP